jgi:23S rRNA (uracil1939-C5)-methyltransferase
MKSSGAMATLEISAMTFGPYGIGRLDGKSVMVPGGAPGDVLEVKIEAERAGYSLGRIERIVAPGPWRRLPPCPFLPRCGGCDWQQIEYPEQVRLKGEIIARELGHALKTEIDPVDLVEPSTAEFAYRSRIRLKVDRSGAVGFHEQSSNRIVPIDRCMVAQFDIDAAAAIARMFARELDEVELVSGRDERLVIVAHLKKASDRLINRVQRFLDSNPSVRGVVLRGQGARRIVGNAEIEVEIEAGTTLLADADLFTQVNRSQNLKLVAEVMAMVAPAAGASVIDLFCGAGNFSIPSARCGARVIGVDSDPDAIAAAARNAARMGLEQTQFVPMNAGELAAFLHRARSRPDAVILDPPRTGAAALMDPVARMRPPRVVYVSCDVSTLARDLRKLSAAGYKIAKLRAFDFFPNTHHVEIAACMVLT